MKVLIFIHSLNSGGAERVAATLASEWAREGWGVTLVTLASRDTDFYALDTRVLRVGLGLSSESGNLAAALLNNGQRVRALRAVLKQTKPNVALAMMDSASVLLALARLGLPIVAIGAERAQPSTSSMGRIWTSLRRWAYRRLNRVVALTPEAAAWIRRHTGAGQVTVIPNPVVWPLPDQPPFIDPSLVGVPGRKRLLAVGRLVPVKGMDSLLTVFGQLAPHHPDWELVILGDGPERRTLQARIDTEGLAGQIILAGRAGNLAGWYRSAHLFVLTSRHEGFPNVVLEAMAHGLACVSFDCEAGPRNIIRHEVDGLLVPDQDIAALTSALDGLMRDATSRGRYAARAREVRERFAQSRISALWRQLFKEVLYGRA